MILKWSNTSIIHEVPIKPFVKLYIYIFCKIIDSTKAKFGMYITFILGISNSAQNKQENSHLKIEERNWKIMNNPNVWMLNGI